MFLNIGWYEIFKDIIIPLLGVLSTIVIGTTIAALLKNKEESAKIKNLLVDNYLLYLNSKLKFLSNDANNLTYHIYKDLDINYDIFFAPSPSNHFAKEKIAKRRDDFRIRLKDNNSEEFNWKAFTFRFAFLLSKKHYDKQGAQILENNITNDFTADEPRKAFIGKLKSLILSDKEIVNGLISSDLHKIENSLDRLDHLIVVNYNLFQSSAFTAYDNKIAYMIDKY